MVPQTDTRVPFVCFALLLLLRLHPWHPVSPVDQSIGHFYFVEVFGMYGTVLVHGSRCSSRFIVEPYDILLTPGGLLASD
eukprot:jgi/Psemu1/310928/fgenesh1_kg.697_\